MARGVWRFGDERVDGCLPGGGLPLGVLHEVSAGGIEAESGAVAAAFLACVLSRMAPAGDVFWVAPTADLYPPGLLPYGFDPARLVQVLTRDDNETLAVLEAVLRSGAAVAAVGEAGRLGRVAAHRLHLACLRHGSTGFVLRRWPYGRQGGDRRRHPLGHRGSPERGGRVPRGGPGARPGAMAGQADPCAGRC